MKNLIVQNSELALPSCASYGLALARQELREHRRALQLSPKDNSSQCYKIYYVRYADHFIIGVNGPHSLALKIKDLVSTFLKDSLHLFLNDKNSKITSAIYDRALFLGTHIRVSNKANHCEHAFFNNKNFDGRILLIAPLDFIVKFLESQGFCKIIDFSKRKIIPTRKTA